MKKSGTVGQSPDHAAFLMHTVSAGFQYLQKRFRFSFGVKGVPCRGDFSLGRKGHALTAHAQFADPIVVPQRMQLVLIAEGGLHPFFRQKPPSLINAAV